MQFILHPPQRLSHAYPPGTLPSPTQLDELTNQVIHYQGSTSRSPRTRARARARASAGFPFDGPACAPSHGMATPPGSADSCDDAHAPRWAHTWRQTRSRLAHVGRLVAKGYTGDAIARALGHVGAESEASMDERMVETAARKLELPVRVAAEQSIGPFKVGAGISGQRRRLSRPSMRRVSSMDFLDEAGGEGESGGSAGEVDVSMEDAQRDLPRHEAGSGKEGGLGRVLRYVEPLDGNIVSGG